MGRRPWLAGLWLLAVLGACGGQSPTGDAAADARADTGSHFDVASDAPSRPICTADVDCSDGVYCNGSETCAPGTAGADARGCVRGTAPCTAGQTCDEDHRTCGASCATPDADGDGHRSTACGGDDCDDTDPHRFPGNPEVCGVATGTDADGGTTLSRTNAAMGLDPTHDEDCDPATFANGASHDGDHDGDGFVDVACSNTDRSGMVNHGSDCQDLAAVAGSPATLMTRVAPGDIHPMQPEVCDGVDNNCNGDIDEGVLLQFYPDCDGDGFGDGAAASMTGCRATQFGACGGHPPVTDHGDCNDAVSTIHPGAAEVCDAPDGGTAIDENCNGMVNEGCLCHVGETQMCCGGRATQTCVAGSWSPCPVTSMPEVCNGVDDDCNGMVDDGVGPRACYDGAAGTVGVGACHGGMQTCTGGAFGACAGEVVPAPEACNGIDDNCNHVVDDGATHTYYRDADGDGYGNGGVTTTACAPPAGYVATAGDCNDGDAAAHPGASPNCNVGSDENCNGRPDNSEWTPCASATDPIHGGFSGCAGHQCAGAGVCVVLGPDTPYRHDADHDGSCVPTNDQFCTNYPLGAEWRVASTCRGGADDCNDGDPNNFPGNSESIDGRDNNCASGCDEGFISTVYSLHNPGDGTDNMLSYFAGEAGWSERDHFFVYNSANGYTVGQPMVRCIEPSGRHFVTQGASNCTSPNTIEGYYGYVLAGSHTSTENLADCYNPNIRGGWAEMTSSGNFDVCGAWAGGDGLGWSTWPGGFGYTRIDGCWAP